MSSDNFKVNDGYEQPKSSASASQPYWHPDESGHSDANHSMPDEKKSRYIAIAAFGVVAVVVIVTIILLAIGLSKGKGTETCQCEAVKSYYISGYQADLAYKDGMSKDDQKKQADNVIGIINKKIPNSYSIYDSENMWEKLKFAKPSSSDYKGSLYYTPLMLTGSDLPDGKTLSGLLTSKSAVLAAYNAVFLQQPINFDQETGIYEVEDMPTEQCEALKPPPNFPTNPPVTQPTTPKGPVTTPVSPSTMTSFHSTDMNKYCDPLTAYGDVIFVVDMACTGPDNEAECIGFDSPTMSVDYIKSFLQYFGTNMPISAGNLRLGVIPYADQAMEPSPVFSSASDFNDYVDKLTTSPKGTHFLYGALEKVAKGLKNGYYNDRKTTVIMMPSGIAVPKTGAPDAKTQADEIKYSQVTMAGVAPVATNAVKYKLQQLVTQDEDGEPRVFQAKSYANLMKAEAEGTVFKAVCELAPSTPATTVTTTPGTTVTTTSGTTSSTMTPPTTNTPLPTTTRPSTVAPLVACELLDIVFVIDSSQSVGKVNFAKLMKFVVDMTTNFKVVGDRFTQFAMVVFNNEAWVEIQLGEYSNIDSLDKRILETNYTTGNTNTKDALETVMDNVLTTKTPSRAKVPNVVILITDGVHTNNDPIPAAKALRSKPYEATIIAIGTRGTNGKLLTDKEELIAIAGSEVYVYNDITYDNLDKIIIWTINKFPCETRCPADVVFIVETAEIIGNLTVIDTLLRKVVPDMANMISMGPTSSHGSLVTFSSPDYEVQLGPPDRAIPVSKVQFGFNAGQTYEEIEAQCKKITWNQVYGISDLKLGMELAHEAFTNGTFGSRSTVPKVAVVIATGFHDEASNCCLDPKESIKNLQRLTQNNTYVVVVDVPGKTNRTVLEMIAGSEDRVFEMDHYRNVSYDIHDTLQTMDCSPPPPSTLVACPQYMDVVILMHYSITSGAEGVESMSEFASYLLDAFSIDNYYTNVAFVTYADSYDIQFKLDDFHTKSQIRSKIHELPITPPSKNTGQGGLAEALSHIATDVFHHAGDRDDNIAPNSVILITDHLEYTKDEFEEVRKVAVDDLKYYDVLLLSLTVGSTVNQEQAHNISYDEWRSSEYYEDMEQNGGCNYKGDCYRHDYHADYYNNITSEDGDTRFDLASKLRKDACANRYSLVDQCLPHRAGPPPPITTPTPKPTPPAPCHKLDLVLVIDESQSVGNNSYKDIKKFLKGIAKFLNDDTSNFISPDNIRLSLVRFSTSAKVQYYFDTLTSLTEWDNNVDGLVWMNGLTNTGEALEKVRDEVFKESNGYRPKVPAAIILVTDGNWNLGNNPVPIAEDLREGKYNAKILSVAVTGGNDIDFGILGKISGRSNYVFNITDYNELESITEELAKLACHYPCPGDIAFLVETSELVTKEGVEKIKQYVLDMTTKLDIGVQKTHEALVHFSNPPRALLGQTGVQFYFTDGDKTDEINKSLSNMVWEKVRGLSDLGGGLKMVRDQIFTTAHGMRMKPPNILIVFALGSWDSGESDFLEPVNQANLLRQEDDVTIYTVLVPLGGAGPSGKFLELAAQCVDSSCNDTLKKVAGDDSRFYNIDNFNEITPIVNKYLTSQECYEAPPTHSHVLDVVFVVDSSQSVGVIPSGNVTEEGFDSIKDFLARLVDRFGDAGSDATQFGLIVYSKTTDPVFMLNKYSSKTDIKKQIEAQAFMSDISLPAPALTKAEDYLKPGNGERSYAPNVVVFLMDGELANYAADPVPVADELRNTYDAKIIAIGNKAIGHSPTQNEELLKKIAGSTGKVFQTTAWADVTNLVSDVFAAMPENSVTGTTVKVTTPTPGTTGTGTTVKPTTNPPGTCSFYDVVALMDSTTKAMATGFSAQKSVLAQLFAPGSGFTVGTDASNKETQVGVVNVASSPEVKAGLSQFASYNVLNTFLNNYKFNPYPIFGLANGFGSEGASARSGMFGSDADRDGASNIAIVFAFDKPDNLENAVAAAKKLTTDEGVTIIVIMGPKITSADVAGIASDANTFLLPDVDENSVKGLVPKIKNAICTVALDKQFSLSGRNMRLPQLAASPPRVQAPCVSGFAGRQCRQAACTEKGTVELTEKPVLIDFEKQDKCGMTTTFAVDSHITKLNLKLQSEDGAEPTIELVDPIGMKVEMTVVTQTSDQLELSLEKLIPGVYAIYYQAGKPCEFSITGETKLSVHSAYVSGEGVIHSDSGATEMKAEAENYIITHIEGLELPGELQMMEYYEDGHLIKEQKAQTRFNCAYENLLGSVTCRADHSYWYKMRGFDENGYNWQRVERVSCTS